MWSTEETTQSIEVIESGEYWASVTNNYGCIAVDTIEVTIVTGLESSLIGDIAVYPNPNNGKFWLVYEFNSATSHVVEVINVEGKTVWRAKMEDTMENRRMIDTEDLEQGIYYLKVTDGDQTGIVRLVIQ